MTLIECFDVGGTSIRGALIQDEQILTKKVIPSVNGSPQKLFLVIQELSIELRGRVSNPRVDYTVIGLPGPVQDHSLLNSTPLGITTPTDLTPLVTFFQNPSRVENDMKLAVKAEYFRGGGKGLKSMYVLTLSTGIGAGLVWDSSVIDGNMGEFGHACLNMDPNSPMCVAGHVGCWVAYSSGSGIQSRAEKEMNQHLSPSDVFSLAKKGNQLAAHIVADARRANAQGLGTMLNVFAVERIIVMGSVGLSQFSDVIPSAEEIKPYTVHPVASIIPTTLGDDIGLWGAYYSGTLALKK